MNTKLRFDLDEVGDRILFLVQIDGLAWDRFKNMLDAGDLPGVESLLKSAPSTVGQVVTTYPSATAPSLPELFTGVLSDRFFKRPRKINAFDRIQKKALKYEFLPEAWEGEHVDVFDVFRMAGDRVLNLFSAEFNAASETYHDSLLFGLDAIGKFSGREIVNYDATVAEKLFELFGQSDKPPRLTFLGLNSADLAGHFQGPGSSLYESSLREIDKIIGRLVEYLKNNKWNGGNLFDRSLFLIFGDHGMTDSSSFIDVVTRLKTEGIKVGDLGSIAHLVTERINPFWMDKEALSVPGGSNIAEIYIRKKRGDRLFDWDNFSDYDELREYPVQSWFQNRTVDLIKILTDMEGVGETVANVLPGVSFVHTRDRGTGVVYCRKGPGGPTMAWQIVEGEADPFGYQSDPAVAGMTCRDADMDLNNFRLARFDAHFHPMRKWLTETYYAEFPGAVALIPKALNLSRTTADIVVNSSEPYNFSKYFRGDHGSLSRNCMTTALIVAGNGVKPGADLKGLMWVDLFPTILKLMNVGTSDTFDKSVDGKVFENLLESAK